MASGNFSCIFPRASVEAEGALIRFGSDVRDGILSLLCPATVLYFAFYALVKQRMRLFEILSMLASLGFVWSSRVVVLKCSLVRSLQLFAGEKILSLPSRFFNTGVLFFLFLFLFFPSFLLLFLFFSLLWVQASIVNHMQMPF